MDKILLATSVVALLIGPLFITFQFREGKYVESVGDIGLLIFCAATIIKRWPG